MAELKFINNPIKENRPDIASCCARPATLSGLPGQDLLSKPPAWVTGMASSSAGQVAKVSTELTGKDIWEHIRCRTSAFRESFTIPPGLYCVGEPDMDSDVLVSANYKLSFDSLRRELKGMDVWILVLDTKGINVWCAAGKGTFGTDELVKRISLAQLDKVVAHRKVVVPQFGAAGISAHVVRQKTGFRVLYGPVRAKDVPAYISAGHKATREMRTVVFPFIDRLVLTPMELRPALRWYGWFAILVLVIFGLQPSGIFFREALEGGLLFLDLGLIAVLAGALFTPVLLPFVPFRSFAVKGWIMGMLSVFLFIQFTGWKGQAASILIFCAYLFFPMASSYIALQFTGSTTYTGMSGVKKELKISIPLYFASGAISLVLLSLYKLIQWRII